jgi:hypothetical protein
MLAYNLNRLMEERAQLSLTESRTQFNAAFSSNPEYNGRSLFNKTMIKTLRNSQFILKPISIFGVAFPCTRLPCYA